MLWGGLKMNLQKKEFNKGYDKVAFYSVMGEYFAEKKYRDEMPYLINNEEKEWRLFYYGDTLAGFYGHDEKKGQTNVSGVYVLSAFRHSEVCAVMVEDMVYSFSSIRMTTSNPRLISHLRKNGFRELSRRGCYLTMECANTGHGPVQSGEQHTAAFINLAEGYPRSSPDRSELLTQPQKRLQKETEWISTT